MNATTPAASQELTPALAWDIFASEIPTRIPDAFEDVAQEGTLHAERLLAGVRPARVPAFTADEFELSDPEA